MTVFGSQRYNEKASGEFFAISPDTPFPPTESRAQVGHDPVAEVIEIDPFRRRSTLPTTSFAPVKVAGSREVVDGLGQVVTRDVFGRGGDRKGRG
jgi:hypothetical protein